jgi:hydroxymethylglutaryl-CoA lyase
MSEQVTICEVGPRDGLQMASEMMATDVKLRWIRQLAAAGLKEIEVGSFVSARLIPQMADTEAIVKGSLEIEGLTVCALAGNLRGVIAAHEAGAHVVAIPISVSDTHSRANVNKSTDQQVEMVQSAVDWVRAQSRPMRIDVAAATAFGCSMEGLVPVSRVVDVASALARTGADHVALADTVGYAHPAQVREVVRAVRDAIGPALSKLHLHDTMGLGLANALAGFEEGIRAFDSCLAGLGGCPFAPGASGNIVTEDLVFMLESMGHSTGIDLQKLIAARALLRESLPNETMRSGVAMAGIPKTFAPQRNAALAH